MSTPELQTFRDTARRLSPAWLQRGRAERYLYALALQLDVIADAVLSGVKLRFPGLYTFETLPLIGRERRIRRGRGETSAVYADRLTRWLLDHAHRGGAHAMLEQLHAYYASTPFVIHLVYKSGRRYVMDASGTITRDTVPTLPVARWARWSLYYFTETFPAPLSDADRADAIIIPREWLAAHALGKVLIMRAGAELWNYHSPARTWNNGSQWNKAAVDSITVE